MPRRASIAWRIKNKGMPYLIPIASVVFILDRLTKFLVLKYMVRGQEIKIIPGVLHLVLVMNRGAAFGLLGRMAPLVILFSVAAVLCIIFYLGHKKAPDKVLSVALAAILGGALGNLTDRILYGHVIDFIDLRVWPVFNVADSFITIGAAILIWKLVFRGKS